jgi:hypothetical protein
LSILAVVPMAQHLLGDPPRSGVIGNPLGVIRYPQHPCANPMGSTTAWSRRAPHASGSFPAHPRREPQFSATPRQLWLPSLAPAPDIAPPRRIAVSPVRLPSRQSGDAPPRTDALPRGLGHSAAECGGGVHGRERQHCRHRSHDGHDPDSRWPDAGVDSFRAACSISSRSSRLQLATVSYPASSYCVGCATVPSVSDSTTSSNRSRYGANRNMRLRLPPVTSARIALS